MSLRRLPIRARLVIGFAAVMALVLAGIGIFVYERTASDLDRQIERELSARLAGVIAIIRDDGDDLGDPIQDPLARVDAEGVVQVLTASGEVADATAEQLDQTPLLSSTALEEIVRGGHAEVEAPDGVGPLRLVADRTRDDGVRYTVIVGASLEEREQALSSLSTLLLIGGPAALVLASIAAYWVIASALRPVDSMRRRASEISEHEPGQRLPVGEADDEISKLGLTLNAMLGRLEGALERERRFVADASHELRTPLSILRAEIQLALERGRSPEELRAALHSVGEETDRLTQLAEDLLVIARADEGRLPIQLERFQASTLAERVVSRFASGDGAARLRTEVPVGLSLDGDPRRLEQALTNLVDNAVRYGRGDVTISASGDGDGVALVVSDQGPGFPPELLDRAFERFSRGSRSEAGTGLGLAIVAAIAAAHGGTARIIGPAAGGSEVRIELPLNVERS
jgi:heavy metal sensor kinase